jgi:hypothetical protein
MNITLTPTYAPHELTDSSLFIMSSLVFFGVFALLIIRMMFKFQPRNNEIHVVYPITIEIPIAVSISIQTVDNEHIGTVI